MNSEGQRASLIQDARIVCTGIYENHPDGYILFQSVNGRQVKLSGAQVLFCPEEGADMPVQVLSFNDHEITLVSSNAQ